MEEKEIKSHVLSIKEVQEFFSLLENHDLDKAKNLLSKLHFADIADIIDDANGEQFLQILEIFGENFPPDILLELSSSTRNKLIATLGYPLTANAILKLSADNILHVFEEISPQDQEEISKLLPHEILKALEEGLSYPEDSAGRIMQKKLVSVPEYWTVEQTIDYIRQAKNLPDDFYEIFVVDPKHKPVGTVNVSKMLKYSKDDIINDIMDVESRAINTNLDQEEIAYIFRQYSVKSVPVTNDYGRLVGRITIDDILEVVEREAEENFLGLSGVANEIDVHSNLRENIKNRLPWMILNLFTAYLSSIIITTFEPTIAKIISLAAIMPIIASLAGNSGTQTMALSICGLNNKEITSLNVTKIILREILVNCINGLVLGFFGSLAIFILFQNWTLAGVFWIALIIDLCFAGFFGSFIPIMMNKFDIDPAISSSVFVTFVTDAMAYITLLTIATIFLL